MIWRIGYGLEPDAPEYAGKTALELSESLQEQGFDGVFLKWPDCEWGEGLQAGGLLVYTSLAVFAGAGLWERFPEARPVTDRGEFAPKEDWYELPSPACPFCGN